MTSLRNHELAYTPTGLWTTVWKITVLNNKLYLSGDRYYQSTLKFRKNNNGYDDASSKLLSPTFYFQNNR